MARVTQPIVLIADDDPDDCLMLSEVFADCCPDCQLVFVHNGLELMTLLSGAEGRVSLPDLILLDLNMPLKDGRQVLREIRSRPGLRHLPILVLTTSTDDEDIRSCYEQGANSYIVKPASYSQLAAMVTNLKHYWINTVRLPPRPECHE